MIDPRKIVRALDLLRKSGHPHYQFFDDYESYEERCKVQDSHGHHLLFKNEDSESEKEDNDIDISSDTDTGSEENQIEFEKQRIMKDQIKKHQFDHNRNTAMTNNYPEAAVDENGKKANNEELSFAPAEGNCPTNILEEKDWDIKSWPTLHPDGRFGIHHKRKQRLTDQQYLCQRLLNKDQRFSKSPSYIFAAAAFIEKKQLMSKANISYMRGKKSVNEDGQIEYNLDDAFTTFDGVKNTPKYWQKVKYDMIAKLENIGPFQFFFTLSCGDMRYDENFSTFLTENKYEMEYFFNSDSTIETRVLSKDERKIDKDLRTFLKEDVSESLHEMIRTNVMTATRNFHHRVETFRKKILMGKNNPMNIKYISYRVEFQGRGAAHIHGTLWLDLKEIEKLPKFQAKAGTLEDAFRKLRDDQKLSNAEKDAIA